MAVVVAVAVVAVAVVAVAVVAVAAAVVEDSWIQTAHHLVPFLESQPW